MAKKTEWVYREILYQVLDKRQSFLRQRNIAQRCGVSAGNVSKALVPLESMNCIEKKPMGFSVVNPKKILLYWASIRNLQKDIIYRTMSERRAEDIEKDMPQVMFTAYSAYRFRFRDVPSDYSEVIVYSDESKIRDRFPPRKGTANIFALETDAHLKKFKKVPTAQVFVDLWNLSTWYANEFVKALEAKLDSPPEAK